MSFFDPQIFFKTKTGAASLYDAAPFLCKNAAQLLTHNNVRYIIVLLLRQSDNLSVFMIIHYICMKVIIANPIF